METDGFEGPLIRASDLPLGAIVVRESIRRSGRKNFTIAHEIGHFVVPGHDRASLACTAADVANWADHSDAEAFKREADEFGAELLIPAAGVKRIIKGVPPSLGIIEKIARVTGASFSAAAWRYCDLVAEKCAVVWSKEGKIQWAKRSADFSFLLRKGPVEESTFAPGNTSLKYPLPGSRYLLLAVPVSMSRRAMRFFIRVARRNRQIAVAQHNRPAGSSPAYPGWTAEDIG